MSDSTMTSPEHVESKLSNFDAFQEYLRTNGRQVTITEPSGEKKQELVMLRNVYFRTRLGIPIIGTDYHDFYLLKASQDLTEAINAPIKIELVKNKKHQDVNEVRNLAEENTSTIILSKDANQEERVTVRLDKSLWHLLDLNKNDWQVSPRHDYHFTTHQDQINKLIISLIQMRDPFSTIEEDEPRNWKQIGSLTPEPKLSRRPFLRVAKFGAIAAVLDSILAHIPLSPSLSKEFWERLETVTLGIPPEQLIKILEEKFQIELESPTTGVTGVTYNTEKFPTIEWDTPRLRGLIQVLLDLPSPFYLPRIINGKEQRVRFALTDVPQWKLKYPILSGVFPGFKVGGDYHGGFCACHDVQNQMVVLDKKHLPATFTTSAATRSTWVHELTHTITSPEIDKYIESITKPIGFVQNSDLWQIFSSEVDISNGRVNDKSNIGYGAKNFDEFFSVAAEYYVKGKDEFVKTYTRFLGKEKSEKLYEGIKQEIFKGKEY